MEALIGDGRSSLYADMSGSHVLGPPETLGPGIGYDIREELVGVS